MSIKEMHAAEIEDFLIDHDFDCAFKIVFRSVRNILRICKAKIHKKEYDTVSGYGGLPHDVLSRIKTADGGFLQNCKDCWLYYFPKSNIGRKVIRLAHLN